VWLRRTRQHRPTTHPKRPRLNSSPPPGWHTTARPCVPSRGPSAPPPRPQSSPPPGWHTTARPCVPSRGPSARRPGVARSLCTATSPSQLTTTRLAHYRETLCAVRPVKCNPLRLNEAGPLRPRLRRNPRENDQNQGQNLGFQIGLDRNCGL